jgi:hypothetical protein
MLYDVLDINNGNLHKDLIEQKARELLCCPMAALQLGVIRDKYRIISKRYS